MQSEGNTDYKSTDKVNILLVEDQKIVQKMLESIIEKNKRYNLVSSIENAALSEMYCAKDNVDLIIMDIFTYQRESGLEAAKKIKSYYPNIKIIIVTSMPDYSFIDKAKEYGCEGFWYKDGDIEEFSVIVEKILSGEKIFPTSTPILKIGLANSDEFTKKELEVLKEMINGYSPKEICERLNIAKSTFNYHVNNLLFKTGYDNKLKLIIDVTDKKLIIPGF